MTQRIEEGQSTGKYAPLIVFAEGGTTNGQYLAKFKRGAFMGLHNIYPKATKFHSMFQSPSSGILEGLPHYLMVCCLPFYWCEIIQLPVFRPNEYFWKHHQREDEERYETYMRVIRDLLSEYSQIPKIEQDITEKFEYKRKLFPHKYKNHPDKSKKED